MKRIGEAIEIGVLLLVACVDALTTVPRMAQLVARRIRAEWEDL